jgi:tetratricopeptide (TPR) repeat protein
MTRGEKIAWIWVWSAMTLVVIGSSFAVWRYGGLASTYVDSHVCNRGTGPEQVSACQRAAAAEQAPLGLRAEALRRLVAIDDYKPETAAERLSLLIQLGMANAEDWNNRGNAYYALREYDKAADDFRTAGLMNGAVGTYWSNLADAQLEGGRYGEAIYNYTTAMRKGEDNAEVRGNRGWARYQLGNYAGALADYDKAIRQHPEHIDNLNERGLVHLALRDHQPALTDLDKAAQLNKNNHVVLTNRGIVHSALGNFDKAGQDLDRAIELDASYTLAHLEKAWLLVYTDRPSDALSELKIVEKQGPLGLSALEARSRARQSLGLLEDAIADAETVMAMNDQYTWPYQLRSEARQYLDDYEGSIADSDVVLSRDPGNMDALVTRSTTLQLAGRFDSALTGLNQAVTANTDQAYAYEARSYFYMYAGRLAEAVADARQAVTLAPQSVHALNVLGWAHIESGAPAAGLRECDRSLAIQETERAQRCRAIAYLDLNQPEKALAAANRAVTLNGISPNNRIVLGRIDLARGKAQSALTHFDAALKQHAFDRAAVRMYRGDAERALGNLEQARRHYLDAKGRDLGLYTKPLADRLAALPQR